MKVVSNGYKNQIKEMGREIDSIITYYNNYKVLTESGLYILTEDGKKILTEQINNDNTIDITAEDIYASKIIIHGELLKTMMKELDFEVKQDIKTGSIVSLKFGIKVNDEYEYIDYGKFIVQEKTYNEDTQTYSYVCYDYMLFTMTPFKTPNSNEMTGEYTLYDLASFICERCGLELGIESFPNSERVINDSTLKYFQDNEFTNRDILDFLTEVTGCSSYTQDNSFIIGSANDTNEIIYADSFKDSNVKFDKVYGPINSILFSRGQDAEDTIEKKDDESIEENGVTQIKIKDNPFLEDNDRSDYFEEMFEVLNGLSYSLNDVSSTGITYLDFLDKYKVQIGENEYDCLLLNDEITIEQGLEEQIFTEEPEETTKEYTTSRMTDKDQKWANIQVKKDVAEINLEVGQISQDLDGKVGNNEIISKINLSPEQINISSSKVNLTGYITASDLSGTGTTTINGSNITTGTISANRVSGGTLTGTTISGDTITGGSISGTSITNGSSFSVTSTGALTCSNATITGGSVSITSSRSNPKMTLTGTSYAGISSTNKLTADGMVVNASSTDCIKVQVLTGTSSGTRYYGGDIVVTDTLGNQSSVASDYIGCGNTNGPKATMYSDGEIVGYFTPLSRAEIKKNFEKLNNAMDIVKDTDIYYFNYDYEEDTRKKHIGFVIGDNYNYRKEVTSKNNDGADLYSMVSVLWQAVKEQQKEIEELKERIGK